MIRKTRPKALNYVQKHINNGLKLHKNGSKKKLKNGENCSLQHCSWPILFFYEIVNVGMGSSLND